MTDGKYDLTRGGISNKLILVALPIIGTQLLLMSYNMVDVFLLGMVGSQAVAASGMAGMYMWLSNGVMLIGRMGAEIGVAQNFGRRDEESARKFAVFSMYMGLSCGLAFALACIAFARPMIGFFRLEDAPVTQSARNYLSIVALGMPLVFVSAVIAGIFNGSGNSRVPFLMNSVGLVTNAVFDPIFIFSFGMGVEGAAIATVIAQAAAAGLALLALTRKKDRPFARFYFIIKPEARYFADILRWSLPIAADSVLFTFFTLIVSRLVAGFGAGAIAVYRVGTQIESLSWLVGIGISTAVTAFIGQNYGAGAWERIRGCCRIALAWACVWGTTVTVLLAGAGGALFWFFLPDPGLLGMGGSFLRIMAVCQIPGCLEAVSAGVFRGFGRTLPPSVVSVSCSALRIPIAYALAQGVLGTDGIWLGITISATLRGLWICLWFLADVTARLQSFKGMGLFMARGLKGKD
ncbi:MAG: MATE family efflux transporter [Synergistaceae bacterium]|jgi:putative MATE family efflux protein|nr:MATE family efflux transporter [Synergistaceae bacterium]